MTLGGAEVAVSGDDANDVEEVVADTMSDAAPAPATEVDVDASVCAADVGGLTVVGTSDSALFLLKRPVTLARDVLPLARRFPEAARASAASAAARVSLPGSNEVSVNAWDLDTVLPNGAVIDSRSEQRLQMCPCTE